MSKLTYEQKVFLISMALIAIAVMSLGIWANIKPENEVNAYSSKPINYYPPTVIDNEDSLSASKEMEESQTASLGTFHITAYCECQDCCGKEANDPLYGITATGTEVTQGRTIAVDPEVIPLGSTVVINGHEFVAEDVGGEIEGNEIDIYFEDHEEADAFANQYAEVYVTY